MESVSGEQGLALKRLFPYKSSYSFQNFRLSFINDLGLKLFGHFDIF